MKSGEISGRNLAAFVFCILTRLPLRGASLAAGAGFFARELY